MKIIRLCNITKTYESGGVKTKALKGINLEINKGDMVSIMGPSGCGKSTLLNILGCIDESTEGEYYIDNKSTKGLSGNKLATIRNEKISFVFQNFALIKEFTVLDNVLLPLDYSKNPKSKKEKVTEILKELGIFEIKNKKVRHLSGGQQQRVAIARALVTDSEVILADEPTGALDEENGKNILEILKELKEKKGKTVIIVTHDKNIAEYGDYIIKMKDGEIVN